MRLPTQILVTTARVIEEMRKTERDKMNAKRSQSTDRAGMMMIMMMMMMMRRIERGRLDLEGCDGQLQVASQHRWYAQHASHHHDRDIHDCICHVDPLVALVLPPTTFSRRASYKDDRDADIEIEVQRLTDFALRP